MIITDEYKKDLERRTEEYISGIKNTKYRFEGKDIRVLKRYKSYLKPKNILAYLHAIFSNSDRMIKLNVLEKVLEEKSNKKFKSLN